MRQGTTLNDMMQYDNTIFDGIILNDKINHGTLVSSIMLRCGLQIPLYDNIDVFRSQVHVWFAAHEWNFNRLVNLIELEYNPLWNKDGTVTETIDTDYSGTENEKHKEDLTKTGTIKTDGKVDETEGGTTSARMDYNSVKQTDENSTLNTTDTYTDTKSVHGFNATDWQNTDKNDHSGVKNDTGTRGETETKTGADTETTTHGKTDKTESLTTETLDTNDATVGNRDREDAHTEKVIRKLVEQGNIGVTMSQQMFLSEVELLGGFNLYEWIAKKFDDDLMIGVYFT